MINIHIRFIFLLFIFFISCTAIAESARDFLQPLPPADLSALEPSVAKQLREARELVDQQLLIPDEPNSVLSEAYGNLGRFYHAYELFDLAEVSYKNAGQLFPTKPVWPYLYAVVNQRKGDYEKAIDAYLYVLKLDPAYDPARIRLAQAYRAEGQIDAAKKLLDELLTRMPGNTVLLAEIGEIALAEGDNATAIEYLTRVLDAVPNANRLHYPLALAYRNLGKRDIARSHMEQRGDLGIAINDPVVDALQELKTGERVQLLQGKLAFNAGDYLAARTAFEKALESEPDSARAHINLASTLGMLGQNDEAISHYKRALELDPKNTTAHFNLGVIFIETSDFETATGHLREVVSQHPNDSQANLYLARLMLQQNSVDEAFDYFRVAAKNDQTLSDAWMGMARLLTANEQYADAIRTLGAAHQKLPDDLRISHALARLLAGSPDLSLRDAKKAGPLAFRVYKAQPTLGHATTAAMALGESEKCYEAANLMENAIRRQPQQVQKQFGEQVQVIVDYYSKAEPCRNAPIL